MFSFLKTNDFYKYMNKLFLFFLFFFIYIYFFNPDFFTSLFKSSNTCYNNNTSQHIDSQIIPNKSLYPLDTPIYLNNSNIDNHNNVLYDDSILSNFYQNDDDSLTSNFYNNDDGYMYDEQSQYGNNNNDIWIQNNNYDDNNTTNQSLFLMDEQNPTDYNSDNTENLIDNILLHDVMKN